MLFYKGLDKIVLNQHKKTPSNELIVISDSVGIEPLRWLEELPIQSTVILYRKDTVDTRVPEMLHNAYLTEQKKLNNVRLMYSDVPVASQHYIWRNHGNITYALAGSAKFTLNGLTSPIKETLGELTSDAFPALGEYLKLVMGNGISCTEGKAKKITFYSTNIVSKDDINIFYAEDFCKTPVCDVKDQHLYMTDDSGLNMGLASSGKTNGHKDDACIPIRMENILRYPKFFPAKIMCPANFTDDSRNSRPHDDNIEIIWDDGTYMTAVLEGMQSGVFPKQIVSSPDKSLLGKYLRNRLGVPSGVAVSMIDLLKYGRTNINISLLSEGVYFFDFSKKEWRLRTQGWEPKV